MNMKRLQKKKMCTRREEWKRILKIKKEIEEICSIVFSDPDSDWKVTISLKD